jgi:hypothetical protein
MMPRPPMNIITKIVNWPGRLQKVEVSTVTSPVTVAAEVAVNNASTMGTKPVPWCENGRVSITVPKPISNPKAYITSNLGSIAGDLARWFGSSIWMGFILSMRGCLMTLSAGFLDHFVGVMFMRGSIRTFPIVQMM